MDADALRAHSWKMLCQLCESHSHRMSRLCKSNAARELIAEASRKFNALAAPATDEELYVRRMQETHVASIIGSVAHADGMARMWSSVAERIFAETRELVDPAIPGTEAELKQWLLDSTAFNVKISSICHDEAMRRYRL